MKSLIAKLFIVSVITISINVQAQSYSGGSGTAGDPYQIATKADLKYLSENSGEWSKHFIQTANIVFVSADFQSGGDFYNSGTGFIPIGNNSTRFSGSYNGGGHSIDNLYIRTSSAWTGLFGFVAGTSNPTISNLQLNSVDISSTNHRLGALAGQIGEDDTNPGTIINCSTNGTVAIFGYYVGGLVGVSNYSTIQNSFSECTVKGWTEATEARYMGGLVGSAFAGTIENSYSTGNVGQSNSYFVGGLIGNITLTTVNNCFSSGVVTGFSNAWGFIASNTEGTVNNSFWDITTSGKTFSYGGTGKTTFEMKTQTTFTGASWNFTSIWQMIESNYPMLRNSPGYPRIVYYSLPDNSNLSFDVTNITIIFNKTVTAQPGKNISIYGTGAELKEQLAVNGANVAISGSQVTITKNVTLTSGNYYILIDSDAFRDGTGNPFTGISNSSSWNFVLYLPDGFSGNALSFPGSGSNYVSIPYSASLNPSDNFTIEFWARAEGNADTYRCPLSSQITSGGLSQGYYFYASNSNQWSAWLGKGAGGWAIINGATAELNKWYHLAMTFSSGIMKFYVNGVLQGTQTGITYYVNSTATFNIGDLGEVIGTFPFNGKVDEIRLWNTARTQQQIQENMYMTSPKESQNLVAYFQLNEGTGTSISDVYGSFSGSFVGSPSWSTNSSVPVGSGASGVSQSFTNGSATLANVTIETTDNFDNAVDISVSQIDASPNSTSGISGTVLSNKYWKIDTFGTPGTFSVDLTFTVPSEFTNSGSASAGLYTLYHRSGNDDGSWTTVKTGASAITSSSLTFEGITSFSQFTIGTTDPLPVELTGFTASVIDSKVKLVWQTATEVNNYGFEIQKLEARSKKLEERWEKVGFVEGSGNSNSPKTYLFVDEFIQTGTSSYRLKQIDFDGNFEYSEIITVQMLHAASLPTEFALEQNYPNPFNPTASIEYSVPSSEYITLQIYDILGNEVVQLVNEKKDAGNYRVNFDASNLTSGIYIYKIQAGNFNKVRNMMLIK